MFIRHFLTLALIFSAQVGSGVFAQEANYHAFTDKKGQAIEAALLSISQDMKTAKIRRRDNREFDLTIVTLRLDDQQYIKNWLKEHPIQTKFNLDVSFVKHQEDTIRIDVPNYEIKYITDPVSYEIIIKNRSRDELIGASIEYYIIVEQAVNATVMTPESQLSYGTKERWAPNEPAIKSVTKKSKKVALKNPLWLINGKEKIKDLPSNYTMEVESDSFPIREISQSGSRNPKDVVIGVIARVTDKNGNEISLHRSSENKILTRSWDAITQMPPGDQSGLR